MQISSSRGMRSHKYPQHTNKSISFDKTVHEKFVKHCNTLNGEAAGIHLDKICSLIRGNTYSVEEFADLICVHSDRLSVSEKMTAAKNIFEFIKDPAQKNSRKTELQQFKNEFMSIFAKKI